MEQEFHYMPNGLQNTQQECTQFSRIVGEDEKAIQEKNLLHFSKERPSKLEKGYSQDLVKQTVVSSFRIVGQQLDKLLYNQPINQLLHLTLAISPDTDKLTFLNPLSPHYALKHHFTSLKIDLIFLQQRVLEGKFPRTGLPIHEHFL